MPEAINTSHTQWLRSLPTLLASAGHAMLDRNLSNFPHPLSSLSCSGSVSPFATRNDRSDSPAPVQCWTCSGVFKYSSRPVQHRVFLPRKIRVPQQAPNSKDQFPSPGPRAGSPHTLQRSSYHILKLKKLTWLVPETDRVPWFCQSEAAVGHGTGSPSQDSCHKIISHRGPAHPTPERDTNSTWQAAPCQRHKHEIHAVAQHSRRISRPRPGWRLATMCLATCAKSSSIQPRRGRLSRRLHNHAQQLTSRSR